MVVLLKTNITILLINYNVVYRFAYQGEHVFQPPIARHLEVWGGAILIDCCGAAALNSLRTSSDMAFLIPSLFFFPKLLNVSSIHTPFKVLPLNSPISLLQNKGLNRQF